MSFAVVNFVDETEEEVVSEVPISWLTEDQKFCKWPPEKYSSIYISKSFPPEANWKEYPVKVEFICGMYKQKMQNILVNTLLSYFNNNIFFSNLATLAEAKLKASKGEGEDEAKVGRGFRNSAPTDYYSPFEEEEKERESRKIRYPSAKKVCILVQVNYCSLKKKKMYM